MLIFQKVLQRFDFKQIKKLIYKHVSVTSSDLRGQIAFLQIGQPLNLIIHKKFW